MWKEKPGNNYGWFVRKKHGLLAVASNACSPGFISSLEYYPERDLTVIVLSNSYSPVSQSPIADEGKEPVLDWRNNLKSALIPVSPIEFIDRQFWARIVVDEDGTGFTYSSSGSRFKVKRVSSENDSQ